MEQDSPLEQLKEILASENYQNSHIETIIHHANLPIHKITKDDRSDIYWGNILNKAIELNELKSLIEEAIKISGSIKLEQFKEAWVATNNPKVDLLNRIDETGSLFELIEILRTNLYWTTADHSKRNEDIGIYSLSQHSTSELFKPSSPKKPPFFGTESYSIGDDDLFFEIDKEPDSFINELVDEGKSQIIVEPNRSGKTSFINAGVIPRLQRQDKSYIIFKIQKYASLIEGIKNRIKSLPDNDSFLLVDQELLKRRPVLIIFDQFELIYDSLKTQEQHAFFESLDNLIKKSDFKIIIACQNTDDITEARIGDADILTNERFQTKSALLKLEKTKSEYILKKLLEKFIEKNPDKKPLFREAIEKNDLAKEIADDCALLSGNNGSVHPQLLQIIGQRLFELTSSGKSFDVTLYGAQKKAEGILLDHLKKIIGGFPYQERNIAWQILAFLKTAGDENGLADVSEIKSGLIHKLQSEIESESFEKILKRLLDNKKILKRLLDNKLIDKLRIAGNIKYKPAFQFYSEKAVDFVESDKYSDFLINQEFRNAWNNWEYHNKLASPTQSKEFYKKRLRAKLILKPVQILFLVRSAIHNRESVAYWVNSLKENNGQKLVSELNDFESFESAVKILGEDNESAQKSGNWLYQRAVLAQDTGIRQTAILALSIDKENFPIEKIVSPDICQSFFKRLVSRAELVGTLLENLPEIETKDLKISDTDRILARFWRIKSQFKHNPVLPPIIYGGFLGGAILGITVTVMRPGIDNYSVCWIILMPLIIGLFLGVPIMLVSFLMVLARFSKFAPSASEVPETVTQSTKQRHPEVFVIITGAIAFGLLNSFWNVPQLIILDWFSILFWSVLGVVAGFGIGLGLIIKGLFSEKLKYFSNLAGGLITFIFFGLFQLLVISILPNNSDLSLIFTFKNSTLFGIDSGTLSVIGAGIVGLAYYFGISFGVSKTINR